MKYEHRGIEIAFRESQGDFTAKIAGQFTIKSSLDAMKKAIDKVADGEFKPFEAFNPGWRSESFNLVTVVGTKNRRYGSDAWLLSDGETTYAVIEKTPENEKIIKSLLKQKAELRKMIEAKQAAIEKIDASLVRMEP